MSGNLFFFFENRALCEIIWKNIVEQGKTQMTVWRLSYPACKATNTHHKIITGGNNYNCYLTCKTNLLTK